MSKISPFLLCLPLLFTSCGSENNSDNSNSNNNAPNREESIEAMMDIMVQSCLSGNEGNPNWEAYCECAADIMLEEITDLDLDITELSEDDAMAMGMEAGMDCLYLLEDDFDSQFDEAFTSNDKMQQIFIDAMVKECLAGNEGNSDWEAYCECAAEVMMEEVADLGLNITELSEDDAMVMGMEAGMDCLYLLEE